MDNRSIQDNTDKPLNPDSLPQRAVLRQQMLAARLRMSVAQWQTNSAVLSGHVVTYLSKLGLPKPGQVVAFCWPIQNEPDVRPLISQWLERREIIAALPVVVEPGQALKFRAWRPEDVLESDRYGIPTPVSGDWVRPDIILLPGNAFDEAGYRLGYGGGFFDRTLAAMHPRPVVVGVCFESARVVDLQPQMHDQAVDCVITESGVYPSR